MSKKEIAFHSLIIISLVIILSGKASISATESPLPTSPLPRPTMTLVPSPTPTPHYVYMPCAIKDVGPINTPRATPAGPSLTNTRATMTMIRNIYHTVWDFREEAVNFPKPWLTPGPLDSMRYAFTEMGEAMDAFIRSHRKEDARNRDEKEQIEEELADTIIMLITAIGPDWGFWERMQSDNHLDIDSLCIRCAILLGSCKTDEDNYVWRRAVLQLVFDIIMFSGFGIVSVIPKRLERIREKCSNV